MGLHSSGQTMYMLLRVSPSSCSCLLWHTTPWATLFSKQGEVRAEGPRKVAVYVRTGMIELGGWRQKRVCGYWCASGRGSGSEKPAVWAPVRGVCLENEEEHLMVNEGSGVAWLWPWVKVPINLWRLKWAPSKAIIKWGDTHRVEWRRAWCCVLSAAETVALDVCG